MLTTRTKLAPPWVTYVNEIKALFGKDPEIKIEFEYDTMSLKLFVENSQKAEALDWALPPDKRFGNVVLHINVVPANPKESVTPFKNDVELFEALFKGNPALSFIRSAEVLYCHPVVFVVFQNKVIQFFNDNLNDVYGNLSTLYQDIASDIFEGVDINGVYFCTDVDDLELNKPLGEWP